MEQKRLGKHWLESGRLNNYCMLMAESRALQHIVVDEFVLTCNKRSLKVKLRRARVVQRGNIGKMNCRW